MQLAPIYLSLALLTSSGVGAQTLSINEGYMPIGLKIPASLGVQQLSRGRMGDILDLSIVSNTQESILPPDTLADNLAYLRKLYSDPCLGLPSLSQQANCQIQAQLSHHLSYTRDIQLVRQKRNEFNGWMANKIGDVITVSEPSKRDGIGRLTLFNNWRLQLKPRNIKIKYDVQF